MSLQDMVQTLIDQGLTQSDIALAAGISQPSVSRILAGKDTSYEHGKQIETLYATRVKAAA